MRDFHFTEDDLAQKLHAAASRVLSGDHRHADGAALLKAVGLLLALCVAYAVSLSSHSLWPLAFLILPLIGVTLAMNAMHDAAHGALLPSAAGNAFFLWCAALPLGIDPRCWRSRHVRFHHPYANIEGLDPDAGVSFFYRQSPFQHRRGFHRFQHLYWPLLSSVSLFFLAWYCDFAEQFGFSPYVKHAPEQRSARGWLEFFAGKAFHLLVVIVAPVAAHGFGAIVIYVAGQLVASVLIVNLILGTHWAEVEFFPPPAGASLGRSFSEHMYRTACDWEPTPAWLGYWTGGLNAHLTHHLFPGLHHRHYYVLSRIVEREALARGLPFRRLGYGELLRCQHRFLRQLGRGES